MTFDATALLHSRQEPAHAPAAVPALDSTATIGRTEHSYLAAEHGVASEGKDHLYLLPHGVIHTSPWIITKSTSSSMALILLTAQRQPFEVTVGDRTHVSTAVAFRPMQEGGVRAEDCPLVTILVHPTHPEYRRFCAISEMGCQPLDRDAFNVADELLWSAYQGQLGISGAQQLLEMIVGVTVRYLPRIRSRDVRCQRLLQMLQENPYCQLSELAEALHVAPARMPHLFTRAVGLPWRSFQLWQKVRAVGVEMGSRRTLTEIAIEAGFSDSAHLSKTWHQFFGAAPSKFFNHRHVQVHYGLCSEPLVVKPSAEAHPTAAPGVCPHCGAAL